MSKWETLDAQKVQEAQRRQRQEATTSANIAGVPVPLGDVVRPAFPTPPRKRRKKTDE